MDSYSGPEQAGAVRPEDRSSLVRHSPRCVKIWGFVCAAAVVIAPAFSRAEGQAASASPTPRLASFNERVALAKSARVKTDLLGLELGSDFEGAQRQLDKWIDPSPRSKAPAEEEEGERKVLWKLNGTDFASIFVKANEQNRITYMLGVLRSGKEIPFFEIGEVEKAPIRTDQQIAWDILRPNRPLIRVVASGSHGKAASITIFEVRRATRR